MARIGIQLMMLKEHVAQEGVIPVLQRVRDTGFQVVEVSQIPMTEQNVAAMESARESLGIEFAAISAKTSAAPDSDDLTLQQHFDLHVEHARRLGTDLIRIGMMPLSAMASQESFDAFAREADEYARRLAQEGISLSYHNHHVEFAKLGGVTLLDQLREKAPHLRYEIDCHWVQRGGRDPERTLADFAGVLDLVHLKDFRIILPPTEVLEASAAGDRTAFADFWARDIVQFAEVGEGTLDWKPVIDQGLASGARHLLIEQDQTYGRDIFDALAMSREHLVSLGYESLITG
ncbi:sugar phosphate isomerase/epimerase family protein [Brachybacterium sacelli]|uniref:Sugar phosphate isomerase/epimerase n=1 Tax=Brachybacterium sacelli TaxID=173364 RepID=A0ABS4X566_9MICO|nr:sugar phosphate isomerase/epimerase [Brachybacterium sacelli]